MTIRPGTRLGPYEVVAPIGAGGMGEVFKGRDTRLDRSVAIKVLPAEFAQNAQLKLRFEREAKAISQLSHPNICTLYDVGDGYLVMELLEGETLADRIAKGPLPLDQIVRIGSEIANALDRAHKAGVVHRDLKPSNIMLTKSGAKLLDFGLAKDSSVAAPLHDPEGLTATLRRAITEEGTLVGTYQYMAPEQLEGGPIDPRTDIFAFGAVLYEMATGRPAFSGKSKASLIAAILGGEPQPITAIQPSSPASLDRLIRTCLSKDPDERWQSAKDIAYELRAIGEGSRAAAHKPRRMRMAWSIAALFAAVAIAALAIAWREVRVRRTEAPVRTSILPPENLQYLFQGTAAPPALSPDGERIVFAAGLRGKTGSLWVRSIHSLVPQQLLNTDGAIYPFWSPDGRTIGFFANSELRKIDRNGGAPVTICSVADGRGGTWSPDGRTIVFGGRVTGLLRVPAAGGEPVAVTRTSASFGSHRWPQFLPDGNHILYLGAVIGAEDPRNTIFVTTLDGKEQKMLVSNANEPHYVRDTLIFTRNHILTAQRFDAKKLALVGDPVPLNEQPVQSAVIMAHSVLTATSDTLVYEPGVATENTRLQWIDRSGKPLGSIDDDAPHLQVALSPDQSTAALSYVANPHANIWTLDLVHGAKTRVTFSGVMDDSPIWSPDGRRLAYASISQGGGIFIKDLATGAEERVVPNADLTRIARPTSWSSDGQRILYTMSRPGGVDIYWISLADRTTHLFSGAQYRKASTRFSPDGKWVIYQSEESGQFEIYLAPFPPTGAKWQVSNGGGSLPRWRADGKEIFYIGENFTKLIAVPVTLGSTPSIGARVALFDVQLGPTNAGAYDVTRDGQRFIVNTRLNAEGPPAPLVVVQHFDNVLRDAFESQQ